MVNSAPFMTKAQPMSQRLTASSDDANFMERGELRVGDGANHRNRKVPTDSLMLISYIDFLLLCFLLGPTRRPEPKNVSFETSLAIVTERYSTAFCRCRTTIDRYSTALRSTCT